VKGSARFGEIGDAGFAMRDARCRITQYRIDVTGELFKGDLGARVQARIAYRASRSRIAHFR
jgi:hypothetical protein